MTSTTTRNGEVAATILDQLGGKRFQLMTGAKNLMAITSGLSMRLSLGKYRAVHVVLDPSDTYTIKCFTGRGTNWNLAHTEEGVYAEVLQQTFTRLTGLATHL